MHYRDLTNPEPWSGTAMTNHALARAMLESGTRVITTYPGSPTPEIAAALNQVPDGERPFYFEYSVNEKVALEVAAGASFNGHLSSVFFKSVGLNVASDSAVQLSMLGMLGGMVIILGDDPGANSSQNEQDNRHFLRMAYLPTLEPATPQEAYDMYLEAAAQSIRSRAPVVIRTTTHVAHAKAHVSFGPLPSASRDWTPRFDLNNGPYWPIANKVAPLKQKALDRLDAFAELSEKSPFNHVIANNKGGVAKKGVIASGLPALAIHENIHDCGAPVDILKLGFTSPLPKQLILKFLNAHDEILIAEELDPVLETEIKALAFDWNVTCRIHSRKGNAQLIGELTPDRTLALLNDTWPEQFDAPDTKLSGTTPPRLPQLCPGCGHRSAFFAVKAAIEEETITVGDIGCHTLGALPPYNLGEIVLCMGHSVSTGSGLALHNNRRKVVAFMGDGTLYHAGLPGIINGAMNDHPVTLVVLDNGSTAMTGHQPRPGTGEIGDTIDLTALLKQLGVNFVREVDAYNQVGVTEAVREAMAYAGFAVVIARHPCMLQQMRKQKASRPEWKPKKIEVNQDTCTRCQTCVSAFACPAFCVDPTGRVTVKKETCIGDGSCIQTCKDGALRREP